MPWVSSHTCQWKEDRSSNHGQELIISWVYMSLEVPLNQSIQAQDTVDLSKV